MTGCADTKARLWSLEPGAYTCLRVLEHGGGSGIAGVGWISTRLVGGSSTSVGGGGDEDEDEDAGFAQDSLLSGGQDGTTKLWWLPSTAELKESQIARPECIATLAHGQTVRGVAAAPDLSFIASVGGRTHESLTVWWPDPLAKLHPPPQPTLPPPQPIVSAVAVDGLALSRPLEAAVVAAALTAAAEPAANAAAATTGTAPKRRIMRRASARF